MTWSNFERRIVSIISPGWLLRWSIRHGRRKYLNDKSLSQECNILNTNTRCVYIDVSVISKHDAGTGIQRVVRSVATQLLLSPPVGIEPVPVSAARKCSYHRVSWPVQCSASPIQLNNELIRAKRGDVFLGLDFSLDYVRIHRRQLANFKRQGGMLWFLMYDLLPIQHPEWFSDQMVVKFNKWLQCVLKLADGIFCISPTVEADFHSEIHRRYGIPLNSIKTQLIPMAGDISVGFSGVSLPSDIKWLPEQRFRHGLTALMVGTLEPRKGHSDVLAAFESLWERGYDLNLVIVGRPGWKTESLQKRIRLHKEIGHRLYWIDNACDEQLCEIYRSCNGVIVASHAEGYGLPVLEALSFGKPVLARDIPIFRLHQASSRVTYFPSDSSTIDLEEAVSLWLNCSYISLSPIHQVAKPTIWADTVNALMSPFSVTC